MTREEAIKVLQENYDYHVNYDSGDYNEWGDDLVEAVKMATQTLEQEPCEDAISRQAVLDVMRRNHQSEGRDADGDYVEGNYRERLYDDIMSIPPVTEQQSKSEWEHDHEILKAYSDGANEVLDKIRAEIHATAEMHEDGDYYLRDEWIDEIFDKYKAESEDKE